MYFLYCSVYSQHIGHRIHTKACLAKNTQQALFSHTVGKHNVNTETRYRPNMQWASIKQAEAAGVCWQIYIAPHYICGSFLCHIDRPFAADP